MSDGESSPRPAKKSKLNNNSTDVSSFFTKASEKPKSELKWETKAGSLLIGRFRSAKGERPAKISEGIKLAAFDLDGTLITTKSKNRFPKDESDWQFLSNKVVPKVRDLHASGYKVVIFSNQAGFKLTESAKRFAQFKDKLKAITSTFDVPMIIFAATSHDIYRKPRPGMFKELLTEFVSPDKDEMIHFSSDSFFVGDAAGRPSTDINRKDFSASDRKLALNIGLKFHTPEEYLDNVPSAPFELDGYDPKSFSNPSRTDHLFDRESKQEIILFVGSPAAGKSSYYKTHLEPLGYVRINQDTLKTRQKCLVVAKDKLAEGQSVCVDNTNATRETRAHWVTLANTALSSGPVPIRVIQFTADVKLCEHNNAVRAFAPRATEEPRELLPAVAFTSFMGRFQEPSLDEGFSRLDRIDFVLRGTPEDLASWRQYWV